MAFYISPPGGNISLQKLTQYAVTRFNFLCKIYDTGGNRLQIFDILNDADTVKDADCLIEGTVKDRVSHFILRLACCCNRDMAAFFMKAETLLFDYRFTCMTEEELCRLFKSVDNFKKSSDMYLKNSSSEVPLYVTHFLKLMSQIKGNHLKWRSVVRRYLNGEEGCFTVPFWNVLHLVASRQVILNKGIANVPVCKLRETVTSLFEELLHNGTKKAAEVFHTDDKRIRNLLQTMKKMFRERYIKQTTGCNFHYDLCHTEVDDIVHMFPPCMSHLHRTLRMNHRLKHHSRIQYSLFLKEAGMSVHEALMFWKKEYSKVPSNSDGCTHVWSKEEGRYTYNIRHLYGLEGSRINYRGHSCTALQESNHGAQDSGGCPFSQFDASHIQQLLHTEGITCAICTEEILQQTKEQQFSHSCLLYFNMKIKLMDGLRGTSQSVQQKYGFHSDRLQTHNLHTCDKLGIDRKQPIFCRKRDDSISCCCHGTLKCHYSEDHCYSNANCCKHLNSSKNAPSMDAEICESKSGAKTLQTLCTDKAEENIFDTVTVEQLSTTAKSSSKTFQGLKCVGKVSLSVYREGVSETNSGSSELCQVKNVVNHQEKSQETVERQSHICDCNVPCRNSCIEHGVCIVCIGKNKSFQKPIDFFESSILHLKKKIN